MRQLFKKIVGIRPNNSPYRYKVGQCELLFPFDHPLRHYQAVHPHYDRLPLYMGDDSLNTWTVDIGANVGDTAAAFASAGARRILCVEPAPQYLNYLRLNKPAIERLGTQITIDPSAVSGEARELRIAISNGTASQTSIQTTQSVKAQSLDEILRKNCGTTRISLIKSDVDGFDWDVLLSGLSHISRDKPALYFECYCTADNLKKYSHLLETLSDIGYVYTLFDNFGLQLVDRCNPSIATQLIEYTTRMNAPEQHTTIYYIDCFAYLSEDSFAAQVMERYRKGTKAHHK